MESSLKQEPAAGFYNSVAEVSLLL